jgi:DNA-binding NarL/FixJ family response regulator
MWVGGADAPLMNSNNSHPMNLLIVDANGTLRKGTELLLRSWGHHVIGSAGDAVTGFELVARRRPDVTLVDQDLPGGGAELARRITDADPSAAVVLHLAGGSCRGVLDAAMRSGARGLVLKSGEPRELLHALAKAASGGSYVTPLIARAHERDTKTLTRREREVLQLLAHGASGKRASAMLTLSPETVRTHIRNASRRLGARTRVHAVTMAIARGEIEPSSIGVDH